MNNTARLTDYTLKYCKRQKQNLIEDRIDFWCETDQSFGFISTILIFWCRQGKWDFENDIHDGVFSNTGGSL